MRSVSILPFAILFFMTGAGASFAQVHLSARLDASQEVPSNGSTAVGTASFILSDDLSELRYSVTVNGLSGPATAAHIHSAAAGSAGPVVKPIALQNNSANGIWSMNDAKPFNRDMLVELLLGNLYVNVHTGANPGGEIRGQIHPDGPLFFTAPMDAAQGPNPSGSPAEGTAFLVLSTDYSTLEYRLTVTGLSAQLTAAHIHNGAAGTNGPPVHPIAVTGATMEGAWTSGDASPLSMDAIRKLLLGELYVNVHTMANPGGEVRGQIALDAGIGFVAKLDGAQERPNPNSSTGKGTAYFSLNERRTELRYSMTVDGLSGPATAAHIHRAVRDSAGGVVTPLGLVNGTVRGSWTSTDAKPLTDALLLDLLSSRLYVNVHTAANPGGEIRGQVELATGVGFTARLDGSQGPSPSSAAGTGSGSIFIAPDRKSLRYDVTVSDLTGPATAAHFHNAPAGANGGAVFGIDLASNHASGEWSDASAVPLTGAIVEEIFAGNYYVNVHTASFPAGELRGQLMTGGAASPTGIETIVSPLSPAYSLGQNYPNPFNPATAIDFHVPVASRVALAVYNVLGERVALLSDGWLIAGSYRARFYARTLPSGVYLYTLRDDNGVRASRIMTLAK